MTHQDWVVELTFATAHDLGDDTIARLDETGEDLERYISRRQGAPGVVVSAYVEAENPAESGASVAGDVTRWLREHDVRGDLVEVRVLTEEQREQEAAAPTMPSLVSTSGAAQILEVTRQRVNQLHKNHSRFPKPLVQLATGPVWDEKAIEWFNTVWERKPGRPRVPDRVTAIVNGGQKPKSAPDERGHHRPARESLRMGRLAAKSDRRPLES